MSHKIETSPPPSFSISKKSQANIQKSKKKLQVLEPRETIELPFDKEIYRFESKFSKERESKKAENDSLSYQSNNPLDAFGSRTIRRLLLQELDERKRIAKEIPDCNISSKETRLVDQRTFHLRNITYGREEFPLDFVKESWYQGKLISEIFYNDQKWIFSVLDSDDGKPVPRQTFDTSAKFPTKAIQKAWQLGKKISFFNYSNAMWRVITETAERDVDQRLALRSKIPLDELQQLWNQDQRVSHLVYGNGRWVIVSEPSDQGITQTLFASRRFPEQKIRTCYSQGKRLRSIVYSKHEDLWAILIEDALNGSVQQKVHLGPNPPSGILVANDENTQSF